MNDVTGSHLSTASIDLAARQEAERIAELERALATTTRETAPLSWAELHHRLFEVRAERIERLNKENWRSLEELVGHKL